MKTYLLVMIDNHGRFIKRKMVACQKNHGIARSVEGRARQCQIIEIWNDGAPICICARPTHVRSALMLFGATARDLQTRLRRLVQVTALVRLGAKYPSNRSKADPDTGSLGRASGPQRASGGVNLEIDHVITSYDRRDAYDILEFGRMRQDRADARSSSGEQSSFSIEPELPAAFG